MTTTDTTTPCDFPPCDNGPGEPCARHEREWGHAEGDHELCGAECTAAADDAAVQVLSSAGAMCGACGDEPGDRDCPDCERVRSQYVAALRAAGWAPRTEVLREAAAKLDGIANVVEAKVAEHYGLASGIGPGSADMVREAAHTLRCMAEGGAR